MLISHKNLLQWTTGEMLEKQAKSKSNRISQRLETTKQEDVLDIVELVEPEVMAEKPVKEINNKKSILPTYNSWDDALEDW